MTSLTFTRPEGTSVQREFLEIEPEVNAQVIVSETRGQRGPADGNIKGDSNEQLASNASGALESVLSKRARVEEEQEVRNGSRQPMECPF
jgi:hypothetical protein